MNIVVLISGNGSNYRRLSMPAKRRKLKAPSGQYSAIRPDAFGLERAREAGIPAQALTADRFDSRDAFDRVS